MYGPVCVLNDGLLTAYGSSRMKVYHYKLEVISPDRASWRHF